MFWESRELRAMFANKDDYYPALQCTDCGLLEHAVSGEVFLILARNPFLPPRWIPGKNRKITSAFPSMPLPFDYTIFPGMTDVVLRLETRL